MTVSHEINGDFKSSVNITQKQEERNQRTKERTRANKTKLSLIETKSITTFTVNRLKGRDCQTDLKKKK